MANQRNIIFAVASSLALLFGFDFLMGRLYPQPTVTDPVSAQMSGAPGTRAAAGHIRDGGLVDPTELAKQASELSKTLTSSQRVVIDARRLAGSINSAGARIDDVVLKDHRQTATKNSGPVRLFSPEGTPAQQFVQCGWVGKGVAVPTPQTIWQVAGSLLNQASPVTLTWDNGQGQLFSIRYGIDDDYMLTVEQRVINRSTSSIELQPYGFINRTSRTASPNTWNLHSGPIGSFAGSVNFDWNYSELDERGSTTLGGHTDWIGFTDIYWMSVIVPPAGVVARGSFRALGDEIYRAEVLYDPVTLNSGTQARHTSRLFLGAKESDLLDSYEDAGVSNFGLAIDWGWFHWFMIPIFALLKKLFELTGNFGIAIILLTIIVRAIMFPIAQKSFASMAKMRAVQPKMKAIQERYKDDKVQLQQQMAKLYKDENVKPLGGCLPMLLQIPIFFALYKTLLIAIEMRHQPFVLWIEDLSAPDPAMILNLFGLLDFTPPSFLGIGVMAVLLGGSMWLQFKLNPQALDSIQRQAFAIMPWVLMFVMGRESAGLLLYWVTSNLLSVVQQRYLTFSHSQVGRLPD